MISVFTPVPPLDPVVHRKITYLRIFGIGSVLGLGALAMVSFIGYLPKWVFLPASLTETMLAPFVLRKIQSLRKPRNDGPPDRRL
jgi:hypothetical protein